MKPFAVVAALASAVVINVASAHAHLHGSVPANHSVVAEAPQKISLQFNEPVEVTSATIQKADGPATPLGPLPKAAAKDITLPAPALGAGTYTVKYRVVSDDGHVMADKLSFSVGPAAK